MIAAVMALAVALNAPGAEPRFSGGFIQLHESSAVLSTRLTRQQWHDVLASMKDVGMTTVIIQHLAFNGLSLMNMTSPADDATRLILSEADAIGGMKVMVGLWNADFPTTRFDEAFFADARQGSLQILDDADTLHYANHASFAGWYIPIEPWNFRDDDAKVALLKGFLASVSARCKELAPGKPVAFCGFFNPVDAQLAPPDETATVYRKVLTGSGIDILMVQDGVGEFHYAQDEVKPYFAAFKAASMGLAEFWANLESFDRVPPHRIPADLPRLQAQLAAASESTGTFVTFDFFHYMNPHKYVDGLGVESSQMCTGGLSGPRKALYDAYMALPVPPTR